MLLPCVCVCVCVCVCMCVRACVCVCVSVFVCLEICLAIWLPLYFSLSFCAHASLCHAVLLRVPVQIRLLNNVTWGEVNDFKHTQTITSTPRRVRCGSLQEEESGTRAQGGRAVEGGETRTDAWTHAHAHTHTAHTHTADTQRHTETRTD